MKRLVLFFGVALGAAGVGCDGGESTGTGGTGANGGDTTTSTGGAGAQGGAGGQGGGGAGGTMQGGGGSGGAGGMDIPHPCDPGSYWDGTMCSLHRRTLELGAEHVNRLESDGSISYWGLFSSKKSVNPVVAPLIHANVPTPTGHGTGWKSVHAGGDLGGTGFGCAIRDDDALLCWGLDLPNGQFVTAPEEIAPGSTWLSVDLGTSSSCGIQTNGTLWCWGISGDSLLGVPGANIAMTPIQVGSDTDWAMVSLGDSHACALKASGDIYCWGSPQAGAIGPVSPAESPILVDTGYMFVDAGTDVTCGIKKEGTLWCWGDNDHWQLGLGPGDPKQTSTPTQVGSHVDWRRVDVGDNGACGIRQEGSVYCWGGLNYFYQLAAEYFGAVAPPAVTSSEPALVGEANIYSEVALTNGTKFFGAACARRKTGEVECWGDNAQGQLGIGKYGNKDMPAPLAGGPWKAGDGPCAVKQDGTMWCWGSSNIKDPQLSPQQVGSDTDWATVTASDSGHQCALKNDQTLWCWGSSSSGALGLGDVDQAMLPTKVGTATWTKVTGASHSRCGIQTNGTIWCWGGNFSGVLGDGTQTTRLEPTPIASAETWMDVSMADAACGVTTGGKLHCWGDGFTATPTQFGVDADWKSIEVGGTFNNQFCGIRTSGELHCWGEGGFGDGTNAPSATPVKIGNATSWAQVSMRSRAICATRTDHTLFCWGTDVGAVAYGETLTHLSPVQMFDDQFVSVESEGFSMIALKTDGSLVTWGAGYGGILGHGDAWATEPTPVE